MSTTQRSYGLDPKAASEAGQGSRIVNESGMYPGLIKYAWGSKNERGTEAVHVIVECDNGQTLRQDFWTYDSAGKDLPSLKMVNALMACVSTRTLTPTRGSVTRYDYDAKQDMPYMEDTYPELMEKRAIFAVQMETYVSTNGENKSRAQVVGVYDAATRQNAAEKLSKAAEARAIDAQARWLEANPVKQAKARPAATAVNRGGAAAGVAQPIKGTGFDDDDIPF